MSLHHRTHVYALRRLDNPQIKAVGAVVRIVLGQPRQEKMADSSTSSRSFRPFAYRWFDQDNGVRSKEH